MKHSSPPRARGLFAPLLLIFFGLATAIIFSIFLSFHFLNKQPVHHAIYKNLKNYAQYLISDLGKQPNQEQIKNLAKEYNLLIGVYGKDIDLKSSDAVPSLESIKNRHFEKNHKKKPRNRRHYIVIKKHSLTYFFGFDKSSFKPTYWPFALALLLSLFFITIAYHLVQKMFKPLDDIKIAAKEYSSGNFNHTLNTQGFGILKELSQSIQEMAVKIQSMLDAKKELLLAIAHELRTPLTRAKLHIEFLEDSTTKDSLGEEINEISQQISDILESERLNGNHNNLDLKKTDLINLCEKVSQQYFSKHKIQIESATPVNVEVDPNKYSLVVKNLLQNAIQYGQDKPITIRIDKSSLAVIDHGCGIAKDEINKITEAFYRVNKDRERSTGGVGLGLYLVSKILQAHGHDLKIESDKNTTFTILFNIN
ncbi:MAG: HAMP domain-containing histidine kinase [Bdellovibrionaceae bacterium]|jgi:signal transduction histidine kinase|nr:HAMP domain-containing histidine kinase [Pseudobdellovibrionaceae bacterium]